MKEIVSLWKPLQAGKAIISVRGGWKNTSENFFPNLINI